MEPSGERPSGLRDMEARSSSQELAQLPAAAQGQPRGSSATVGGSPRRIRLGGSSSSRGGC